MPLIAFIFTHRIQYFTNLLDELQRSGRVEPVAIYAHETADLNDPGFSRQIAWDNRGTAAFQEILLPKASKRPHGGFLSSWDRSLGTTLSRLKPDLVHLNGYAQAIQWQAWSWARKHRVSILIRGDGDMLAPQNGLRAVFRRRLALFFTRRAAHVFYQGDQNRKYWLARGAFPKKMSWLPCVSDTSVFHRPAFKDSQGRNAFRSAHGAHPDDLVLVVSGKLQPRKRPADALHLLHALTPSPLSTAVRIWFLGSGPLEPELRTLAITLGVHDRVNFCGFQNQTEMPSFLQAADVLLHLSEADPWPYSVLDGAASGLALLLSDRTGSFPDWQAPPTACHDFPCGNVTALAAAVLNLAENQSVLADLQNAAKQRSRLYTEREFCSNFESAILPFLSS